MQYKLTIAFSIVDENGKSILQENCPNGVEKIILVKDHLGIASSIRTVIASLADEIAQDDPQSNQITQDYLLELKNTDEEAYIKALYAQLPRQGHFEITELESNQNESVQLPISLKQLRGNCGAWWQESDKNLDSSKQNNL